MKVCDSSTQDFVWERGIDGFWVRDVVKFRAVPRYTASVDAALALVERCGFPLGERKWNYTMAAAYGSFSIMPNDPQSAGIHDKRGGHARGAPTIPLSIISALLSAIIARQALKDSSHE